MPARRRSAAAGSSRQQHGAQGGRQEKGQAHVERVEMPEQEIGERAGEGGRGEQAGAAIPQPGAREAHDQHAGEAGQRGPQSRRPLARAERHVGGRGGPVLQRRLLEVLQAVQAWGQPVAGRDHLARDLGIAAFVRLDQFAVAESAEPDQRQQQRQDREPRGAGPAARAGRLVEARPRRWIVRGRQIVDDGCRVARPDGHQAAVSGGDAVGGAAVGSISSAAATRRPSAIRML